MVYADDPFLDEDTPHGEFRIAVHPLRLRIGLPAEASALVRTWAAAVPPPLTVSGLPDEVLALFDPHRLDAGAVSRLTMSAAAEAKRSTHSITVTATCPTGRIARAHLVVTIR